MKTKRILTMLLAAMLLLGAAACTKPNEAQQTAPNADAAKNIKITVTYADQTEEIEISTTEETLGAALLEKGLISGTEGEFGLFVDTVNGHFADASKNEYWVFTKGGEWVTTGVDTTPIEDGDSFEWSIYQ